MKHYLLTAMFCLSALVMSAAQLPRFLSVWAKDGTVQTFALAVKPQITFSDSEMIVTAGNTVVNFAIDELSEYTYEESDVCSIDGIGGDDKIDMANGDVVMSSLPADATVSVVTTDGRTVFSRNVKDGGDFVLPMSRFKEGAYIINVNGVSYKIIKK